MVPMRLGWDGMECGPTLRVGRTSSPQRRGASSYIRLNDAERRATLRVYRRGASGHIKTTDYHNQQ